MFCPQKGFSYRSEWRMLAVRSPAAAHCLFSILNLRGALYDPVFQQKQAQRAGSGELCSKAGGWEADEPLSSTSGWRIKWWTHWCIHLREMPTRSSAFLLSFDRRVCRMLQPTFHWANHGCGSKAAFAELSHPIKLGNHARVQERAALSFLRSKRQKCFNWSKWGS